jgi:hypothetical protein
VHHAPTSSRRRPSTARTPPPGAMAQACPSPGRTATTAATPPTRPEAPHTRRRASLDGGARTNAAAEALPVLGGAGPWPRDPEEAGAPGGLAQGGAWRSCGGTGGSERRHGGVPASTPANAWM